VGEEVATLQPGDVVGDRYLCKSQRIFLDTKPGLLPTEQTDISPEFASYLRLSPYQIHVPQIYDLMWIETPSQHIQILFLDQAAIYVPNALTSSNSADSGVEIANPLNVQLLPALVNAWQKASALRQLNWLWQLAQLWQPLSAEQVVSSLLTPELIRVEGPLVRLLELQSDGSQSVELSHLGKLWSPWVKVAKPAIVKPLVQLCQQLTEGQIRNPEQLIMHLDELLQAVGRWETRQVQIATLSDRGPSRHRNEDACYPPSGTVTSHTLTPGQTSNLSDRSLVIVCDGIGGHQGGDVASNLAIETVWQQLQTLPLEDLDPITLTVELEKAACAANDVISQRNDNEQRYDRQRMGTTLVIGLVHGHELYITHVGDSRAYWITRWSCRQVTLDDDVASREVRLGYSLYREALQQPTSGSLVQALGMGASSMLHPSVQRFVLDEDNVFLLCSDGLSDNNRVDENWDTVILPLLEGKTDIATASHQLIEIANTRNGHDNVTVVLLHVRIADLPKPVVNPFKAVAQRTPTSAKPSRAKAPAQSSTTPDLTSQPTIQPKIPGPSTAKTRQIPERQLKPNPFSLLLGIILLLGCGGVLAYFFAPSLREQFDVLVGWQSETPSQPVASGTRPEPNNQSHARSLQVGSFVQLSALSQPNVIDANIVLMRQPIQERSPTDSPFDNSGNFTPIEGAVPVNSVLYITKKQRVDQEFWVEVRVCHIPSHAGIESPQATTLPSIPESTPKLLRRGDRGWIRETVLSSKTVTPAIELTAEQQNNCVPPIPSTPPIPTTGISAITEQLNSSPSPSPQP
jgi:protein phosphatase